VTGLAKCVSNTSKHEALQLVCVWKEEMMNRTISIELVKKKAGKFLEKLLKDIVSNVSIFSVMPVH